MTNLMRTIALFHIFSGASLFASECDVRLSAVPGSEHSWADRLGTVSDFIHIEVEDPLWATTIFGKEAVETEFRGRNATELGLVTVLSGENLDVYWGGRKINYFDFARGRVLEVPLKDYGTKFILPGAEGLQLEFVYYPGLRRSLEIWVSGLSSRPSSRKILTARSGLEFVH